MIDDLRGEGGGRFCSVLEFYYGRSREVSNGVQYGVDNFLSLERSFYGAT